MATKTFKIGESSRGGIITVETTKDSVTLIAKEWDYSAGSSRSSNQTNAKETHRLEVSSSDSNADRKLLDWLCEESTSYYAETIMKWVRTKIKLSTSLFASW